MSLFCILAELTLKELLWQTALAGQKPWRKLNQLWVHIHTEATFYV